MLRILHLEDRQEDAFLIENAILNWGIPAEFIVVRDRPEFVSALEQSQFDLILADNGLPGFDGLAALKMVRQQFPSIGFICVSGAAGENQTRASFQAGATDYVLKDDLSRLVATVRREWDRTQLLRMNRGMARLIAAVQELSLARDLDGVMAIVRRAGRELTGADGATFVLREGDLCHYADEDAVAPLWKGQKFPLSACISGWVMLNRQAAVIEDIYADPRIPADAYRPTFVKSLAMVPIRTVEPVGAIGNYWGAPHRATEEEIALLRALADSASIALENVRLYSELEDRVRARTADLERANEHLQRVQADRQQLANMVIHDLQNPLTGLTTVLRVLRDRAAGENRDILDEGLGRCDELSRLILNVLHVSRAEAGKLQLASADLDLSDLARDVVDSFRRTAELGGRSVHLEADSARPLRSDEAIIRRILQNLLRNALRHTPAGSRVLVRTGADGAGRARVDVSDDGPGIPPEIQSRIFEPFGAAALRGKGIRVDTGLGLPTCKVLSDAL